MKKHKALKIILIILIILAVLIAIGHLTNRRQAEMTAENGMILFYGSTCPHCRNVEEYIAANGIKEKIDFQELEVYENKDNAKLLAETAKKCGLGADGAIGVPFFFDGTSCLQGDEPIIEYFKNYVK